MMKITKKISNNWNSVLRSLAIHKNIVLITILIAGFSLPLITSNRYILRIATLCLLNCMLALGLNLVTGYMGQMSFGQAAFWGIGAYAGALITLKLGFSTIPAMFLAAIIAGFFGYLVALPSLKLKGYYLTIVTMGFCEIVRIIELNWTNFTGGSFGISKIPRIDFFGISIKSSGVIYIIALVFIILLTLLIRNLVNSTFGLSIKGIRDDDDVAEIMGIDIVKIKRITFVISAMIAGATGAFYAQYVSFIHPSAFTYAASQEFLVMIIFGGLGSIPGTFLGVIVFTLLPEVMRSLLEYRMMIYGALMVIMMILKPDGILGSVDFDLIRKREVYSNQMNQNQPKLQEKER